MSVQKQRSREDVAPTDRKTLLVCPMCDHRAPTDGDWAVTEFATAQVHRLVYECPECWHTVVVQPVFDAERVPEEF